MLRLWLWLWLRFGTESGLRFGLGDGLGLRLGHGLARWLRLGLGHGPRQALLLRLWLRPGLGLGPGWGSGLWLRFGPGLGLQRSRLRRWLGGECPNGGDDGAGGCGRGRQHGGDSGEGGGQEQQSRAVACHAEISSGSEWLSSVVVRTTTPFSTATSRVSQRCLRIVHNA